VNIVVWFYWLVTASYFPVQCQIRRICITICAVKCKNVQYLSNVYCLNSWIICHFIYLLTYLHTLYISTWVYDLLVCYWNKLWNMIVNVPINQSVSPWPCLFMIVNVPIDQSVSPWSCLSMIVNVPINQSVSPWSCLSMIVNVPINQSVSPWLCTTKASKT